MKEEQEKQKGFIIISDSMQIVDAKFHRPTQHWSQQAKWHNID
jgi:hypothetical protein